MDVVSEQHRSWIMSRIRGKNTKPELLVRSLLHRMGYRFRIHVKSLPGKPDIVLPRHRIIIFVDGCFWHRHPGCKYSYTPKTRIEFWGKKFQENVTHDIRTRESLRDQGWSVWVIWECETRDPNLLLQKVTSIFQS